LIESKKKKLVNKIGISVYTIEELKNLLSKYELDIVSIPFNIIDQRLKSSGWLYKLKKLKVDIYARSIFLQGLLLMREKQRPKIFKKWNELFRKWDMIVKKSGKSRLENCLGFVLNHPEIDKIILGFDNYNHFAEIIKKAKPLNNLPISLMARKKTNLINPSKWRIS